MSNYEVHRRVIKSKIWERRKGCLWLRCRGEEAQSAKMERASGAEIPGACSSLVIATPPLRLPCLPRKNKTKNPTAACSSELAQLVSRNPWFTLAAGALVHVLSARAFFINLAPGVHLSFGLDECVGARFWLSAWRSSPTPAFPDGVFRAWVGCGPRLIIRAAPSFSSSHLPFGVQAPGCFPFAVNSASSHTRSAHTL